MIHLSINIISLNAQARKLQKPFSAAVNLHHQLESRRNNLLSLVLQLSDQEVFASQSCPACFGPEPPNPLNYRVSTRNKLIVCLDGNFQHRHQIKASQNHEQLQTPQFFLSQAEVNIFSQEIRDQEAQGMSPEQVR